MRQIRNNKFIFVFFKKGQALQFRHCCNNSEIQILNKLNNKDALSLFHIN